MPDPHAPTRRNFIRTSAALLVTIAMTFLESPTVLIADNTPTPATVAINTRFPGGNADVTKNESGVVHVQPDLRGDRPWFYWCFEAVAATPGRVRFVFPEKVVGFNNGGIGFQGPAISTDDGKTWRWMGTEQVNENAFHYDFEKKNQRVRFAVTIPYVQSDLETFIKASKDNVNLKTSVLTKSKKGRNVELLQVGKPSPGKHAVLMTGRHHAAETIASYVLEGFVHAAMADDEVGKAFRKNHVLYAIPFVDKDGVEEGDQGKNRKPHDHNRDYGETSIYPEVQAIKKLHDDKQFRFALDMHCPTLVMADHQVMYFVGAKAFPPSNLERVSRFAKNIRSGLTKSAPHGPLVWLRSESTPSPKNSRYFAFKPGMIMSATLEIPFAPPGKATDTASCRKYGRVILKAFVQTDFEIKKAE